MRIRTSPPKTSKKNYAQGFTLIEMMIVLVIVAAVVAFALPKLNSRDNNIKSVARKLSVLSRSVHNAARLSGKTYRLVLQLGKEAKQLVWIESSSSQGALVEVASEDPKSVRDDDKDKKKSAFQMDGTIMKSPMELPKGLFFEDIELSSQEKKVVDGKAFVHFLPQGFTDETAIHVTDTKDLHWTFRIHPLTGNLEIIGKYMALKDLRIE